MKSETRKTDRLATLDPIEIGERAGDVGAALPRLEVKEFADDAQDVVLALLRRDVPLHLRGENDEADAVVVLDCGEREQGAQFRSHLALERVDAAEGAGGRGVDHEHDREFALFDVLLYIEGVHARGDVPVDDADIVALHIAADFGKLHASALEHAVVFAGENGVDHAPGADLDAADLLQYFTGYLGSSLAFRGGSWHFDAVENLLHDVLGRDVFRLCLIGNDDAVAQHVHADGLDIFRRHIAPAPDKGVGRAARVRLSVARGDAPQEMRSFSRQGRRYGLAAREDKVDDVIFDLRVHVDFIHYGARREDFVNGNDLLHRGTSSPAIRRRICFSSSRVG